MRLFIDTNIFLDVVFERENYKEAVIILNSIEQGIFEGIILDITILNIDYIANRQNVNIKSFLSAINDIFLVVGATNEDIKMALNYTNKDLEDNLQYILALKYECDLIISNDKNFIKRDLKVLNSKEFINRFLN